MADDLPGFIEDEPKPAKKQPAQPEAPAAAFNPFAEVKVSLDPSAAPATTPEPKAAPGAGKAAKPGAPGTGRTAKPAAPAAPAPDPTDADVVPGQGKDLWSCPHCGARNKPGRETCRSCGKSPADEVEVPWHAKPGARLGIAAGVVVLLALIVLALVGGGDVALAPADAAHVDAKPRIGKRTEGATDLGGGKRFVAERRFAVCGRVLLSQTGPAGTTQVLLVLGKEANDDAAFNAFTPETGGSEIIVHPEPARYVSLLLIPGDASVPKAQRADYVSLLGATGVLEQDGQRSRDLGDNDVVVRVDEASP